MSGEPSDCILNNCVDQQQTAVMGSLCSNTQDDVRSTNPDQSNIADGPVGSTEKKRPKPVPKKLTVHGHYFNSDTRTIVALLKIAQVDFEMKMIDIFKGDHQKEDYLKINPCGTIPMVTDQDNQLMGSINIFVNYLTEKNKKLQSYAPREHAAKI